MPNEYTVYILENDCGRHYIGLSADVTRRLSQHNEGKSKWTAKHGPRKLIWGNRQLKPIRELIVLNVEIPRNKE